MKKVFFISLVSIGALISCNGTKNAESEKEVEVSTFESQVRSHTEKYCKCAKPLSDFTKNPEAVVQDSLSMQKLQALQTEFVACFDPNGELKAFRDTLSQEMKNKQLELFDKYRKEICPDINPQR